jgi:hypothetical protein
VQATSDERRFSGDPLPRLGTLATLVLHSWAISRVRTSAKSRVSPRRRRVCAQDDSGLPLVEPVSESELRRGLAPDRPASAEAAMQGDLTESLQRLRSGDESALATRKSRPNARSRASLRGHVWCSVWTIAGHCGCPGCSTTRGDAESSTSSGSSKQERGSRAGGKRSFGVGWVGERGAKEGPTVPRL